MGIVLILLRN